MGALVVFVSGLAGLEVDTVDNGQAAVERIAAQHYDLVLLDMQMPVMSGTDAARAIRRLPGKSTHPFILAMTANAFAEDRERCLAAGMDDHIGKPFKQEQIVLMIEKWKG